MIFEGEEQLAGLVEAGTISEKDATEIRNFSRFLEAAERREDGKLAVPAEWMPYAKGTGPAPEAS